MLSLSQSFELIKQSFNVKNDVKNHLSMYQIFTVNEDKIRFSSDEIYALLELMFSLKRRSLLHLLDDIKPDEYFMPKSTHHEEMLRFQAIFDLETQPEASKPLYSRLRYALPPKWMTSFKVALNDAKNDYIHAWHWSRLCRLIYAIIKRLNARTSNRFSYTKPHLKLLLAIHEIFDSFKAAIDEWINENIPDNEDLEWVDVETIPYHKTKQPIIPRGVHLSELIHDFFMFGAMYEYGHLVLDLQPEELELNLNDTLDQVMLNLLNDITFYIRFLPGVNLQALIGNERTDDEISFNIHAVSNTRKAILRKHQ